MMPGWLDSIKFKVFLVVVLVAGAFVALADTWFYRRMQTELLGAAAAQSREVLAHASQEMVLEGRWLPPQQLQRISDFHTHRRHRLKAIWPYDQEGHPLLEPGPDKSISGNIADLLHNPSIGLARPGPEPLFVTAEPVIRNGRSLGHLVGLLWLEDLARQLDMMERSFWWLGLGGWALLIAVLYGTLHWLVVRPLERLESASTALARGEHQVRARVQGRDELGRLGAAFNSMADSLTESLAATNEERQRLRAIIDTQSDCLFTVDADRRLTVANRRLTGLLGLAEEEMIGRNCSEILHSDLCTLGCPVFGDLGASLPQGGLEARLRLPGGREIPIRKNANLFYDGQGRVAGAVETFQDISQEKELARLRAEWESFIRHELKNPLNPILALSAELLHSDPEPGERRRWLELIHTSARNLSRLLALTSEVQLYEAGRFNLNLVPHDLVQTITQAAGQASAAVTARPGAWKGQGEPAWALETEPGIDTAIPHDPEKMTRVFQNLMQNAWEHDSGPVTVRLYQPAEGWLRVAVHNQGEPVPPERLATIFEKFNTTKQELGGSGLGTTIARVFTEAHGGAVGAASSAGAGTEFSVTLPRQPKGS